MMSVSLQLKALYERFDGMVTGKAPMTTYEAAEFKRDMRTVMARVGLMELGIANDTFDAMIQEIAPGLVAVPIAAPVEHDANVISLTRARLDRIAARCTDGGDK
ncbi:hypothetical protein ACWAT4_26405 [Bradyrhizobium manausense]